MARIYESNDILKFLSSFPTNLIVNGICIIIFLLHLLFVLFWYKYFGEKYSIEKKTKNI